MRIKHIIFVAVLVSIASLTPLLTHEPIHYENTVEVNFEPRTEVVEIEPIPQLRTELVPICACESVGDKTAQPRQFYDDGSVIFGHIDPDDTGMCQINVRIHGKEISAMGLDVKKEADNITFANHLYDRSGTQPWFWSSGCWK